MTCPKCGSPNVSVQVVNEAQLKTKHKGVLYWLCVGWWWLPIKWLFLTLPALIIKIFRPKKKQIKNIQRTMCVCQTCGYTWEA